MIRSGLAACLAAATLLGCVTGPPLLATSEPGLFVARPPPGTRIGLYFADAAGREYGAVQVRFIEPLGEDKTTALTPLLRQQKLACTPAHQDELEQWFVKHGYQTRRITEFNRSRLAPNPSGDSLQSHEDFRPLVAELGLDELLVVDAVAGGTVSESSWLEPGKTLSLRAYAERRVQLVELASNRLLWNAHYKNERLLVENWDSPPDYPLVKTAVAAMVGNNCASIAYGLATAASR